MSTEKIKQLELQANELRKAALTMIYEAQSGHPGGAFSAADIVTALYFSEMKVDPNNPKWEDRDRFVLSKGHVCPIQYAALGYKGFFPEEHLHTLRKEGSILQGHPCMKKCPGIDISTGSLGQGVSCAVGMAIGAKMKKKDYRVFVMAGDGEMNEGIIWEAMMCANKYRLDNLVLIMDNNGLQIDGTCDQVMPLLDMSAKAAAFGFETYDIDGHDMEQILATLDTIRDAKNGKPKFINAKTVKGKGVDFMENKLEWHGTAPNAQQYEIAMAQLEGRA
ncbi:MAG: transketolase [Oscillospiraceae bacterium]|nr:transketolase [Oscillospiraceae bacterium]